MPETQQQNSTEVVVPVVAPEATPPVAEAPASGDSKVWDELDKMFDTDESMGQVRERPETKPVEQKPVEVVAQPVVEPAKPAAPATPASAPPAAPVETPATPASQQRQLTPAEQQAEVKKAVDQLEKMYQLTPEQAAEVIASPEKVLPRLLAQAHFAAATQGFQAALERLPHEMQARQEQVTVAAKAADEFFTAWPELNKPELHQAAARIITTYRRENPKATKEEAIRDTGPMVFMATKTPIPSRLLNTQQPQATPHTPAGTGASSSATPPPSNNPFTLMAEEMVRDGDVTHR